MYKRQQQVDVLVRVQQEVVASALVILPERGQEAVSYTHLDVYKRQVLDGGYGVLQGHGRITGFQNARPADLVILQAVSYTHLDNSSP